MPTIRSAAAARYERSMTLWLTASVIVASTCACGVPLVAGEPPGSPRAPSTGPLLRTGGCIAG
jgi:hypothetical protein